MGETARSGAHSSSSHALVSLTCFAIDKENRRIVWEIKALAKWTRDYQSSRLQAEFIDTITGLVQFAIQDRRAGEPFDVVLYIDVIDAGLLNFGLSVPGHAAGNFPALFGALTRIVFFGRKNGMSGGAKVMFDMLQNYLPVEVVFESGGRENVLNWVQSKEDVPPQFFDPAATRLMPRSEAVWAAFQKMHASEGDQWTMADVFLHEPSGENTEALSAGDSGLLCREKEQVDDERAKEACSPFTRHERTLKETASRRQSLPAIEELGDGALDEVAEGDEDEQW
jgi:hypothetical protein